MVSLVSDKPDRFSYSPKIRLKRDPPVYGSYTPAQYLLVDVYFLHSRALCKYGLLVSRDVMVYLHHLTVWGFILEATMRIPRIGNQKFGMVSVSLHIFAFFQSICIKIDQ